MQKADLEKLDGVISSGEISSYSCDWWMSNRTADHKGHGSISMRGSKKEWRVALVTDDPAEMTLVLTMLMAAGVSPSESELNFLDNLQTLRVGDE